MRTVFRREGKFVEAVVASFHGFNAGQQIKHSTLNRCSRSPTIAASKATRGRVLIWWRAGCKDTSRLQRPKHAQRKWSWINKNQ